MAAILTKSRYMAGLVCPRQLWMLCNAKDELPPVDPATQHLFDQGHEVGRLAQTLFPGGIALSEDFKNNITETRSKLALRKPLFEAGFSAGRIYSRADILNPAEDGAWDIIEVKSSTKVKDDYVNDVAFQKHCYTLAGIRIRRCYLMLLNPQYERHGALDAKSIFAIEDISQKVESAIRGIEDRIESMLRIIDGRCPSSEEGRSIHSPGECDAGCWDTLPANSVFNLYRMGKNARALYDSGIVIMKDVPADYELSEHQKIQVESARSGNVHVDMKNIAAWLRELKYPLQFLDFETINPALPLFEGMRPFQRVPFQFSLHIMQDDGKLEHYHYLAGKDDPRDEFMKQLKFRLLATGSIVVYNMSFEKAVLSETAAAIDGYSDWVNCILPNFVDLIVPFRNFWYYNPLQQGSNSIKDVLPAMTGRSYSGMEISEGNDASVKFMSAMYTDMNPAEREKIRNALLAYCGLDTEAMVLIVRKLEETAK
jgi:hypothetical protein